MTSDEFKSMLVRLGLSQRAFAAILTRYSDSPTSHITVYRWSSGARKIPAAVALALSMMRDVPGALEYAKQWRDGDES